MTLKDVVAVAGKPGLYKILKMTRTGMIIESMEGKPIKTVVNASHRISVLNDISIYTHTQEESISLEEVFSRIIDLQGKKKLEVDIKDNKILISLLEDIVPEYDRDKVYASDVKKLVSWFNLLLDKAPETLDFEKEEDKEEIEENEAEEGKEAPTKASKKKEAKDKKEDKKSE